MQAAPADDAIHLAFANGASVAAHRLVLNMPQRPLLRLLGNSHALAPLGVPWPAPLTYGTAYPIVKGAHRPRLATRAGGCASQPSRRPRLATRAGGCALAFQ